MIAERVISCPAGSRRKEKLPSKDRSNKLVNNSFLGRRLAYTLHPPVGVLRVPAVFGMVYNLAYNTMPKKLCQAQFTYIYGRSAV